MTVHAPGGFQAQLLKGTSEVAVLQSLSGQSQYGLQLLDSLTSAGWPISDGTIYPLLHRLQKQGAVDSRWNIDPDEVRPRKYYSVTESGRSYLRSCLAELSRLQTILGHLQGRTS